MNRARGLVGVSVGLAAGLLLAGCPISQPYEYVAGGTGDQTRLGSQPSVDVLSPTSDLAIAGGTPVEVNWSVVATTGFASVDIIFDLDQDPENGNEVFAEQNLALTESTAVLDTTGLEAETYFIGVVLEERNEVAAFDYASGRLTVNQRPQFFFSSPRDNYVFDRTQRLAPQFEVAWELYDPDSTVQVQIFLDPDDIANGNEFLLRESDEQNSDSFTFNLPLALFEPGVYRILAIVSDGVSTATFYAPASIRLRSRLAGNIDLRDMHLPESGISGAIFEGFNPRDNMGSFVSSVRDLDGDGFEDFVMLAQFAKPGYFVNAQRGGIGEAYIVHGRADRFSGTININSIGALFRGWIYEGVPEVDDPTRPSRGITSFTVLSDWDLDGVRDFAFGLPFTDSAPVSILDAVGYFRTGCVVVASSSSLRPDLGFPGSNPVYVLGIGEFGTLPHEPFEEAQCTEGFIGPKAPFGGGGDTSFHRHLADVGGTPNNGSIVLGCRLSGNEFGEQFGESISAYEYDSIIISSPNSDPAIGTYLGPSLPGAGVVYVYYNPTYNGNYPWSHIQAPPANDAFGYAGLRENPSIDIMPHGGPYHYIIADSRIFADGLASPGYTVDPDDSENPCERVWSANAPQIDLTLRIWGQFAGARLTNAKAIGDFNSDGIRDLVVGSPLANEGAGSLYIVLGRFRNIVVGEELPVNELALPMNGPDDPQGVRVFDGIQIVGEPGTRLGESQDRAGDFNGDGLGDVLVGSPLLSNRHGGAAIFYGSRTIINLTQEEIAFEEIPRRGLGVVFRGEQEGDRAGARVAAAGDVDGDGLDDVLIAAPNASVRLDVDLDGTLEIDRAYCGVVYLIYGSPDLEGVLDLGDIGTEQLPGAMFIGRNSGDHLGAGLGEQGDRSWGMASAGDVDGDGHADLLMSSVLASPRDRERAGETYLLYGQGD